MALSDFKKVLDIEPENKAAKNQVIICQQKIKQQREEEHKRYGGMFEKFAQMDAKVWKSSTDPAVKHGTMSFGLEKEKCDYNNYIIYSGETNLFTFG